jgi:hypothetical protein
VADVVNHLLSDPGICLDGQNIVIRQQPMPIQKKEAVKADLKQQPVVAG